mgnify:CR=1 FL=1
MASILVIEDNNEIQEILRTLLTEEHEVIQAFVSFLVRNHERLFSLYLTTQHSPRSHESPYQHLEYDVSYNNISDSGMLLSDYGLQVIR